ncbi:RusA family crossover junction endodeoxyribonuclease [Salibacterium aidingense]|uniref:RusA family crossover junction endodeoxyribonuclease n=1 Tax=Salibacterium aidingense TaxID=384933 RepID=UPI003BCFC17E
MKQGQAEAMNPIYLSIPGRPVPAVRMTRRGVHVKKSAQRYLSYKSMVGWIAKQQKVKPIDGPVEIDITVHLCGGNQGDIDNYAKSITDGLNTIAYEDDKQIHSMHLHKRQCSKEEERAEVKIQALMR